jgi:methyl-accepting chemotaxis protein
LAKRTSDSTGEIEQLLGTLGSKTEEVTQKMSSCLDLSRASVSSIENARDSFEGIQLSVNEIRDQNLQISAAAEEQHSVAEEINRHIQQIYDEARLVESLANSAQDDSGRLANLSDELNGLVGRFKS